MTRVVRVLAPNPGPMTLEGTNTWIVGERPALVIDPGPDDPGHIQAVARDAGRVEAVLLTHRHPDHADGAAALGGVVNAPVLAFRPTAGGEGLADGQQVKAGGVRVVAIHTPGHSPDHVVFHEPALKAMFTGDMVLGRGTSVLDPPEGDVTAYMRSLERMSSLKPNVLYPGHGPAVWAALVKLDEDMRHRELRESQVVDALAKGASTPSDLVPVIYASQPKELWGAAERTVLAHLIKLEREGRAARVGAPRDNRFASASPHTCRKCGRQALPRSTLCGRCSLEALQEPPPSSRRAPGATT